MADLNEARLIGRLTRDPEMRTTPAGQFVCQFGLATGRKYKGQDGNFKDETTFVECQAWGKTAELLKKYTKKGRSIYVGGRLRLEQWTDKTTGEKRSKMSVVVENVQFLDKPEEQTSSHSAVAPATNAAAVPETWDSAAAPDFGEPPF